MVRCSRSSCCWCGSSCRWPHETAGHPKGSCRSAQHEGEPVSALLAIVVPLLNDAAALAGLLPQLVPLRDRGALLVVADGGSRDDGPSLARQAGARVVTSPPGRALQMNAGAAAVPEAQALWFLHADTTLPPGCDALIEQALRRRSWGRFDVQISGRSRWLPVVAGLMNARSRLTGIATGDQGLFMRRAVFDPLGGYAPIALMEDVEICGRLRRIGPPACLRQRLVTSGRRWDTHGALRTIGLMWWLRLRYACGASPDDLLRLYSRPASARAIQHRHPAASAPVPPAALSPLVDDQPINDPSMPRRQRSDDGPRPVSSRPREGPDR